MRERCPKCHNKVYPIHRFDWKLFFLLPIIYFVVYVFWPTWVCPICHTPMDKPEEGYE